MWHDVKEWGGISVWVDEKTNRVIRGLKGEGWNQKAIYPYERQGDGWTNCSSLYTLSQLLKKKYHVGIKEPPPGDKSGGGFLFAPQHQPQGQEQRKMECNAMAFPKQVYRHSVQLSSSSQRTTARRGRRGRVRGPVFRVGRCCCIHSGIKTAVTITHLVSRPQLLRV